MAFVEDDVKLKMTLQELTSKKHNFPTDRQSNFALSHNATKWCSQQNNQLRLSMTTKRKATVWLEQDTKRTATKTARGCDITKQPFFSHSLESSCYRNKSREELDITDEFLSGFYAEFAAAVIRPVHFFVSDTNSSEQAQPQLKFKTLSHSVLRLAACLTIRHR